MRRKHMRIIDCDITHADAILAIFNEAIVTSTALYDYRPRTPEMMQKWFEAKLAGDYPILGAVDENGTLLGFATYGPFRAFPAYKYTVEHSVYVASGQRGRGIGRVLLEQLIARATGQSYHVMVGVIDASNAVSIALHERFGFAHAGRIGQVGFKFGRWLDVCFYQLTLPTPLNPVDG